MVVRCGLEITSLGITVRHHRACRSVIPSDRIFSSQRTTFIDSFTCILFFRQLHLSLNMHCFYEVLVKISQFAVKNCSVRLLSMKLTSKHLVENSVKTDIKKTWAAWWQNQQNGMCTQQPGHPPSLSLHCPHEDSLGPYVPIQRTVKTLIRLGGCWVHSHFVGFVMRRLISFHQSVTRKFLSSMQGSHILNRKFLFKTLVSMATESPNWLVMGKTMSPPFLDCFWSNPFFTCR